MGLDSPAPPALQSGAFSSAWQGKRSRWDQFGLRWWWESVAGLLCFHGPSGWLRPLPAALLSKGPTFLTWAAP